MLLILLVLLALIDVWEVVIGAGLRVTLGIVLVTLLALCVGHLLGGPKPATRTATAISGAARNPGLAPAGRHTQSCATGHRGDDSRLSGDRGLHRTALRDLAPARCAACIR